MNYGTLAGLDKPVSQLILGAVYFEESDQAAADSVLDRFFELGGNCVDVAHAYGRNAAVPFGNWIASRGVRDKVVILDKGCHPYRGETRYSTAAMVSDMAEQRELLQVDSVDIWMFHRDDPETDPTEVLTGISQQIKQGLVTVAGASNWSTQRLALAHDIAAKNDLSPLVASSPNLCLAIANEPMWGGCITLSDEDIAWHEKTKLPVFAWSSVGRGFFAGFEDDDVRRVYFNEENFKRRERTEHLAKKRGAKPVQIALAWVVHQTFPVFPLIGCRTPGEVEDAVEAIQIQLDQSEIEYLVRG